MAQYRHSSLLVTSYRNYSAQTHVFTDDDEVAVTLERRDVENSRREIIVTRKVEIP